MWRTAPAGMRSPLVESAFEYGSAEEAHTGFKLNKAWYQTYGVTHGTTAADWVGADFTAKELSAYFGPDPDELEARGDIWYLRAHCFARCSIHRLVDRG